jgi:hypothetical protein
MPRGLANGRTKVTVIAIFTARIVRDPVLDNDSEQGREFDVEAEWGGQRLSFRVSAAEFGLMSWMLNQLGPQAIVYPGQQQHARAAIQCLSGAIRQETHLHAPRLAQAGNGLDVPANWRCSRRTGTPPRCAGTVARGARALPGTATSRRMIAGWQV